MKKFAFFFVLLISPLLSLSQSSCGISSKIFYINGVNKPDEMDVVKSSQVLKKTVASLTINGNWVHNVNYLYNDSTSLFFDIFHELASQKALEKQTLVADEFVATGLAAMSIENNLSQAETDAIRERYASLLTAALPLETNALLAEFSKVVKATLTSGIQVILVPHSQGNMFANDVFDGLKLSLPANLFRGLGIVNIASPASRAPSGLYITAAQDLVINLASYLQSIINNTLRPLVANFDASFGAYSKDISGHGFTEVYLSQDLPSGSTPENSIAGLLAKHVDIALYRTSTFIDPVTFALVNGVKVSVPASSTSVQVCFPGPVGGV